MTSRRRARARTPGRHARASRPTHELDDVGEIDPLRALELVHARLVRVEALALAADVALESAPSGSDPLARRGASRLYEYVVATAEAAGAALDEVSALVERATGGG